MPRTTFVPDLLRTENGIPVIDMAGDVQMLPCQGGCGIFIVERPGRVVGYTCPACHPLPKEED